MTKNAASIYHPELNHSRMNRDYFFPDVLNANVQEMKVPTVGELIFIGGKNLREVQSKLYIAENQLSSKRVAVNHTRSVLYGKTHEMLMREFASEDGHIHCDWCGIAHEDIPDDEAENMSYEEWDKATKDRLYQTFNCKFGITVARLCHQVPHPPTCDKKCFYAYRDTAKIVHGSLANETIDSTAASWQEYVDVDGLHKCSQYEICHGDMPLKDKTCIFENNFSDVEWYIKNMDEVIEDYSQRIEFIKRYLTNIDAALKSEWLENKASFNLRADYHLRRAEHGTTFAFIDWEGDDYTLRYGVLALKLHKQIPQEFVLTMLNDGSKRIMGKAGQDDYKGLCLPQKDFLYLMNHSEYWRVWLQSINTEGTNIVPEKLLQTLAKLAVQRE